jgi:L-ascorbate metabolism protein UlaG (beta-lactamase superfamily)
MDPTQNPEPSPSLNTPTELLRPVCAGDDLIHEIGETQAGPDQLAIWWLGQSGYCFKWNGRVLYIDLYLSEHLTAKYAETDKPHIRMTESPLRGPQIRDAELVLSSHKHSDHLDPGTLPELFQASPSARLLLPKSLIAHAEALGLNRERLIPTDDGERHEFEGITIEPLPSAHEALDWTEEGGYPYLGFLLRFGEFTVYHSGDTVPYEGLEDRLRAARLDLAFLPINGRDERRKALGVPGNMTIEEAVELTTAVRPKVVIPHHYDMFTFNTADVREFEAVLKRRVPEQAYRILRCGERWIYSRSRR